MGCGSSAPVVNGPEEPQEKAANGNGAGHSEDIPTVVLPDTPEKPKPPIAFEIPLEEFDSNRKTSTPPRHVQRLLLPPAAEISLPDIKEKLAEAEQRRKLILQQRAASAQKGIQKMTKNLNYTDRFDNGHTPEEKHGPNLLTISPRPGVCEDRNIS